MTKDELKLNARELQLKMLFDEQEKQIEELEQQIELLGKRGNQLLKDKGNLTDELQELKETFAQTIENDEVAYETLKLHDQEEIGMLNSKVTELENKIADIKANCDLAIEGRDIKIRELEQENNNLLDVINNQDVKIADLEKENAELDMKRKAERQIFQGIVEKKNEQLTKAKFLLKQLVDAFPNSYSDVVKDTLDEARKFVEE